MSSLRPYLQLPRGYTQSWNFTLEKGLAYGFVGQVGYVASRQVRQLGRLDLNAGQIPGAGRAGQPLFTQFGRTAEVRVHTALGTSTYDSLQAKLERRFSGGFHLGTVYTWSKAMGTVPAVDNTATNHGEGACLLRQEPPLAGFRSSPQPEHRQHHGTTLWPRQALGQPGDVPAAVVGGWGGQQHREPDQRYSFHCACFDDIAEHAWYDASRRPSYSGSQEAGRGRPGQPFLDPQVGLET